MHALPLAAGRNEGGHYFRYFCPSGVVRCPWLLAETKGGHYFGPSVLRAPAEQTKVTTVFGINLFLLLPPLFKTTEGVVVLFQIFACGPELPIE